MQIKTVYSEFLFDFEMKHFTAKTMNMNIEAMNRKSLISTLEMMGIKVVLNENSYSKTIDKKCIKEYRMCIF